MGNEDSPYRFQTHSEDETSPESHRDSSTKTQEIGYSPPTFVKIHKCVRIHKCFLEIHGKDTFDRKHTEKNTGEYERDE